MVLNPFSTQERLRQVDEFWRVRSPVELEGLGDEAQTRALPFVRRWAEAARDVDGPAMLRDYSAMTAIQQATTAATEAFDLVLSPVAPQPAFPAEWRMPRGRR